MIRKTMLSRIHGRWMMYIVQLRHIHILLNIVTQYFPRLHECWCFMVFISFIEYSNRNEVCCINNGLVIPREMNNKRWKFQSLRVLFPFFTSERLNQLFRAFALINHISSIYLFQTWNEWLINDHDFLWSTIIDRLSDSTGSNPIQICQAINTA